MSVGLPTVVTGTRESPPARQPPDRERDRRPGVGRGGGAHAPDEWLLIDSTDPKVAGYEQQAVMFAEYPYEVARAAKTRR